MEIGIRERRRRRARRKVVMCVSQVAGLAAKTVVVSGVLMVNLCTEKCKDGRWVNVKGDRYIRRGTSECVIDYLDSNPTYPNHIFRRKYRVLWEIF